MSLARLIRPRSVAVLGATDRLSIARVVIEAHDKLGFEGPVWPVNPRYETVLGRRCYPGLKDLPGVPDMVAVCLGHHHMRATFRDLADCGAGGAVIYDGGFAEFGEEGRELQAEIEAICAEAGIALCGPNCMGILNPQGKSSSYSMLPDKIERLAGNVGFISHSGSVCVSMLSDVRRFGFSTSVSAGNEAVVTSAAYLEHMIDDPHTKVIACFLEAVREPDRFVAGLDRAASAGKPVVVLKSGKSERARGAIAAHTGALAGESRVFSEVLKAHRAIEVQDMNEMTEVLAAVQGRVWPKGPRVGVVTASGGMVELILDAAAAEKVDLPPLSPAMRDRMEEYVPVHNDGNPMDTGIVPNRETRPDVLAVLGDDPDSDAVVLCVESYDLNPMESRHGSPYHVGLASLLADAAEKSAKPYYLLNVRSGIFRQDQNDHLIGRGVATVTGARQGLAAIDRLGRWSQPLPSPRKIEPKAGKIATDGRRTIHEYDAKRALAAWSVPVSREILAATLGEAHAAARQIGYPVVLKAVSDDIPHKSEHGLVAVGLADDAALGKAWAEMERRVTALGTGTKLAGFLVQEMVSEGVEVFAGVSRDPDFGPMLAFGLGGVEIEVIRDVALRPLPLREGDAEAMIGETQAAARLRSIRGRPAADVKSLAACLYALADFAWANADRIAEIDLNPIKVRAQGKGCVVVDALIVPG